MTNPSGLCKCGCGERTTIATQTSKRRGHVKGEPTDYVRGHGTRRYKKWEGELPLCACGCGRTVSLSTVTDATRNRGEPNRFLRGHWNRPTPRPPVEMDLGYETPCHIWQGQIMSTGYPRRDVSSGSVLVHRHVYAEAHGEIPAGMDVHHLCGQPACVRLDHLTLMSRSEHIRRHRGITPEKYEAILDALRSGEESQGAISRRFGVSKSYVWELRRKTLP